jgi:predicted nuclease with TOPRIM domain
MRIDIELLRARNAARRSGDAPDVHVACDIDIDTLLEGLDEAERELARLQEENEDLRASAELWADLYEASLERANALQEAKAALPPDYVKARDAVFVLREALDAFIRDCNLCAAGRVGQWHDAAPDSFCANCVRAVAALQTARQVR